MWEGLYSVGAGNAEFEVIERSSLRSGQKSPPQEVPNFLPTLAAVTPSQATVSAVSSRKRTMEDERMEAERETEEKELENSSPWGTKGYRGCGTKVLLFRGTLSH